jgi:hypothetical protein
MSSDVRHSRNFQLRSTTVEGQPPSKRRSTTEGPAIDDPFCTPPYKSLCVSSHLRLCVRFFPCHRGMYRKDAKAQRTPLAKHHRGFGKLLQHTIPLCAFASLLPCPSSASLRLGVFAFNSSSTAGEINAKTQRRKDAEMSFFTTLRRPDGLAALHRSKHKVLRAISPLKFSSASFFETAADPTTPQHFTVRNAKYSAPTAL